VFIVDSFINTFSNKLCREDVSALKLRAKPICLTAGGKPVVILTLNDAEELGVLSLGRVKLSCGGKTRTCIVNTTKKILKRGEIGLYDEVTDFFGVSAGREIDVEATDFPASMTFIRNRLKGRRLNIDEIREIVQDVTRGNLSEVEITSFIIALEHHGLNLDEAAALSTAMVETGETLKIDQKLVADKHSIGGVPGDKTTLLVVPIIASYGIAIPKTSSRAITSPAGSADRAEILMDVNLEIEEIKRVVKKTNGCIVWGGAIRLAPADDIFVQVEYPLSIDPLLLPSIMSKKKAVGATRLVVDVPLGRGTKVKTIGDADLLARDFIELGGRLGIKTQCALTYGEQPVGHALGSALEAREALEVLSRKKGAPDLIDKACDIAGILLGMCGLPEGRKKAAHAITSGKAEEKLREIIREQGGNPKIKPDDLPIGEHSSDITAETGGYVKWISNWGLVEMARSAGSPKDKGAGVVLHKKLNSQVKRGEPLLTIYAKHASKLQRAEKIFGEQMVVAVGERMEMTLKEVKEVPVHEKAFILER